jgi:hypothetical protein
MDKKIKSNTKTNPIFIISGLLFFLICINILFILLFQSDLKTYKFTQKEMEMLDQDRRIIAASADISEKYKDEIEVISSVFPSEADFPTFIQTLENNLKNSVEEYQFKFNPAPIAEGDKQFLLMTIIIKTDLPNLILFFTRLEQMPYMTHITSINAKTPAGIAGKSEYSIGIKIYVQNPFNTK